MQFKSRKPKPPTGMEMSVTFLMPTGMPAEDEKIALLRFLENASKLSKELGLGLAQNKDKRHPN